MEDYQEIIENLFIGGAFIPLNNPNMLFDNGITHIVDLTFDKEFKSKLKSNESKFEYMKLEIDDSFEYVSILKNNLVKLHSFINKGRVDGKVLVHCNCGVSRSATLIISYLISTKSFSLKDAVIFLKSKRDIIQPNIEFMKLLIEYEFEENMEKTFSLTNYYRLLSH